MKQYHLEFREERETGEQQISKQSKGSNDKTVFWRQKRKGVSGVVRGSTREETYF